MRRNIVGDHRSGANHAPCTDRNIRKNDGAGTDERSLLNLNPAVDSDTGRKKKAFPDFTLVRNYDSEADKALRPYARAGA